MNPNLSQTLDPKLKEAYDRVMGTGLSPKNTVSSPTMTASATPQTTPQVPEKDEPKVEMVNINTPAETPSAAAPLAAQPAVSAKKK